MKAKNIPYTVAPDGKIVHSNGETIPKKDWFDIVNYIILGVFAFLCIYPFLNIVLTSFASDVDVTKYKNGLLVIPENFNFGAYTYIFKEGGVMKSFINSVIVTLSAVVYSVIMMSLGGYALTKKDLPGKNIFFTLILITMFFGGGVIPFFLVLRDLGLYNNLLGLIIPFGINTFNMILLRNFFANVPEEVLESAKLDGAGEMRILFGLVIPLSLAGLATIALFQFVGYWNDWYWPLLLMKDEEKFTLALKLKKILEKNSTQGAGGSGGSSVEPVHPEVQGNATIIVSIIPILCVYPFVQKYFVKGVMLGSVKS
jgi:putative aldouronate transport system permease protein